MERLLVANRGEIAVRVFRTCRRLGIETVAVVAADDAGALHAREADTVVEVGSYLDPGEHVRAAQTACADAVHPGYGFLSESPRFAAAVEAAGLVWVGPPVAALEAGGDKLASKQLARKAGVPVVESGEPEQLGFPLLVKAAAGGGGRGMRIVHEPDQLAEALAAAQREAEAAFGDGTVFCERYLERPRHVEIQLLADNHGTIVALGERDCSIQRRHQKLLEESPSPALDPGLRTRISEAAVAFARAIGYIGAGTAEFMVSGQEFYFLELNARIQVEHPVTEAVTGIDLVAQQLRIADGQQLTLPNHTPHGHAIEVRLYAEHPHTFLPQTGQISRLRLPDTVRVDAGIAEGDQIGTRYDPMIAKLIAHAATRDQALAQLRDALATTEIQGVTTNLPFLRWLLAHPVVRAGQATTAFLDDHPPLSPQPAPPPHPWDKPFRLNLPPPTPKPPPNPDDAAHDHAPGTEQSTILAPMPGTIIRVHVAPGDTVAQRQTLLVLEAMKMETPLTSPYDATIRAVHAAEGDTVTGGTVLIELDDAG